MQRSLCNRLAVAAASLSLGSAALADLPRDFCPRKGGAIDATMPVDKDELASSLLDAHSVPRRFERKVVPLRKDYPGLDPLTDREFLLLRGMELCEKLGCSDPERKSLRDALMDLSLTLAAHDPRFTASLEGHSSERFFLLPGATLRCVPTAAEAANTPSPAPGASPATPAGRGDGRFVKSGPGAFSLSNVRLRGSASDLLFEHGLSGYADASKAKLSFENDRASKTKSAQLVAAIGYAIPVREVADVRGDHPYSWALRAIPYAAFSIGTSHVSGQARTVKTNQFDSGATIEFLWSRLSRKGSDFTHQDNYLGVYPHYLIDYKDHSAIAGLNVLYRPYVMRGFNSLVQLGDTALAGNIIGNLRFNNGHFTRIGTRDPSESRDFSRIGGELGLYVGSTKAFPIPFDATVSGIYMQAIAGKPKHLSQLKADLGIYFTSEKTFGLDLAYTRGRVEDLDEREHKFTFGLAVKY